MNPFWRGLLIGFSIAAPVGPIGVLCVRRSISDGRWIGFATGLGAATADAAYGAVAAFGLTAVADFLVGQRLSFGIIGGSFLCWLGGRTFFSQLAVESSVARNGNAVGAFTSTLLLTLTNPMTILSFAAVFAGFGFGAVPDFGRAGALVAGVFAGSAAWWLVLSMGAGLARSRVTPAVMRGINRISGAMIFGFGVYALGTIMAGR
jgi:threonine/homoserine/homoserine lactone efflux protein